MRTEDIEALNDYIRLFGNPKMKNLFLVKTKDILDKIKKTETSPKLESLLNKINDILNPPSTSPKVDISELDPILERIESLI